jgi:hypothetical protein
MRSYNYQSNRMITNGIRRTNTLWGRWIIEGFLASLIAFLVAVPFYIKDGMLLTGAALF